MSDLILYSTDDGKSQKQLRADWGTVWLTQLEMAKLFQSIKSVRDDAHHFRGITKMTRLGKNGSATP